MTRIPIFILLALLLTVSSPVKAQLWQQTNGTGGDHISSIAVNKQGHIFVVSRGLQRSTDGGVSWVRLFETAPLSAIRKIISQPSGRLILSFMVDNSGIVNPQDGFYSSDDNGKTWQKLPRKLRNLWEAGKQMLFGLDSVSYLRSTDDGRSWEVITLQGVSGDPSSFFISSSGNIFVSAEYLYRSTDNGKSWSKIVNGLTIDPNRRNVVVQGAKGALFSFLVDRDSVFRSTDSGRTWSGLPIGYFHVTGISINDSGKILLSSRTTVLTSTDNGLSWKSFELSLPTAIVATIAELTGTFLVVSRDLLLRFDSSDRFNIVSMPNGGSNFVLATARRKLLSFNNYLDIYEGPTATNWQSIDNGNTWSNLSIGIRTTAICIDSSKNIIRSTPQSISRSTDDGLSWVSNSPELTDGQISSLAVGPLGNIFAASTSEGIFRSSDNGLTWDQLNSGISDQRLYSVGIHSNGNVFCGGINKIYRSTNNGLLWTELNTNFPQTSGNITAMVVNTQGNIIAGVQNAGVFWSTDNGNTWSLKATGLNATAINALVSTPSGKVFAATNNGVFFLDTSAGTNWVPYSFGITATNILSLCRDTSGRLYAGTDASGIFRSNQTFNLIPNHGAITQVESDRIDFATVSVSTSKDTLLKNFLENSGSEPLTILNAEIISDQGPTAAFELVSPTMSAFPITIQPGSTQDFVLRFHPNEGGVHSAIWRLYTNAPDQKTEITLSGTGNSLTVRNEEQSELRLADAYPNPMNRSVTIPFSLAVASSIRIDLIDALGRVTAIVTDEVYNAGSHTILYKPVDLKSGSYYLRLSNGRYIDTKPIIKFEF